MGRCDKEWYGRCNGETISLDCVKGRKEDNIDKTHKLFVINAVIIIFRSYWFIMGIYYNYIIIYYLFLKYKSFFVLLMKSHLQSYPCPIQINSSIKSKKDIFVTAYH